MCRSTVEAAVAFAYTGRVEITMSNVTSLFLLSTTLGCSALTSGCIKFLEPRLLVENVESFWSIANATMNQELMSICVPVIANNFDDITGRPMFNVSTDAEYLALMLRDDRLSNVPEDSKLRVITTWFEHASPDENVDLFTDLVGTVELGSISSRNFVDICTSKCVANLPANYRDYLTNAWKLATKPGIPRVAASSKASAGGTEVLDDYVIAYQLPNDNSPYFTTKNILNLQPDVNLEIKMELRPNCEVVSCWRLIFFIGGEDEFGTPTNKVDLLALDTGDVVTLPSMYWPRKNHCAVVHDRLLFVFGGYSNGSDSRSSAVLNMPDSRWDKLPDMPTPRLDCSVVHVPAVGDIVVGGWQTRIQRKVNNVELLSLKGGADKKYSWRKLTPMLEWRRRPGVAHFRGLLVVAGGNDGEQITVESFSLPTNAEDMGQWTQLRGLSLNSKCPVSLAVFKNRLLLVGNSYRVMEFVPKSNDGVG
uniref:BACK domain-containing protein n=1 Tax=Mesocestoides corti TaxID=53468 RepID=A0A5K3FEH4_MESCO